MTPQEIDKEFELDPESSDGPSDDDETDNEDNVSVTSLEPDDEDNEMQVP